MTVRIGRDPDGLSVGLGHSFAPEDATELGRLLAGLEPDAPVVIDFRAVRDCHDAALSLLARAILAGPARVTLRGTSQHQERLLRYLGVPSARASGSEPA
jgi:hypothetical protein